MNSFFKRYIFMRNRVGNLSYIFIAEDYIQILDQNLFFLFFSSFLSTRNSKSSSSSEFLSKTLSLFSSSLSSPPLYCFIPTIFNFLLFSDMSVDWKLQINLNFYFTSVVIESIIPLYSEKLFYFSFFNMELSYSE